MSESSAVRVKRLHPDAQIPQRAHPEDAGLDLYAYLEGGAVVLEPGACVSLRTGLVVCVPSGFVGFIKSRSGLAFKQNVWGFDGTIDSTYRGELLVMLHNRGSQRVQINDGDKIAQLVVVPVLLGSVEVVDSVDLTERGAGGFGSTGRR